MSEPPVLEVSKLTIEYRRGGRRVTAVSDVSFTIRPGQTIGLVGESGSGKTTIGRAILGLVHISGGRILFEGRDVTSEEHRRRRSDAGQIRAVFQDPYSSLNPSLPVAVSVVEEVPRGRRVRSEAFARLFDLFDRVGLSRAVAASYPGRLSGGQRQRVAIARALMSDPRLIICDEPVSALDVSVQAQVLNVLKDTQRSSSLSYCFIGHDLDVVRYMSDWIVVLYRGQVLEDGPAQTVARSPRHPYTQALVAASPDLKQLAPVERRKAVRSERPEPASGDGCPFAPRCGLVEDRCWTVRPPVLVASDGGRVACHRYDPDTDSTAGVVVGSALGGQPVTTSSAPSA